MLDTVWIATNNNVILAVFDTEIGAKLYLRNVERGLSILNPRPKFKFEILEEKVYKKGGS